MPKKRVKKVCYHFVKRNRNYPTFGDRLPRWMLPMTMLTASQRQILEDIASGKSKGWQEAPDVFGDHQMLYEDGLITGVNASADDGFGLLDMRLTMAGQQALTVRTVRARAVRESPEIVVPSPMEVRIRSEEEHVPVVRPLWKRWGIWKAVIASVGACILFVIGVWTFIVEIVLK